MVGFLNFYISNFLFHFILDLILTVFEGQKDSHFTKHKTKSLIRLDILSCDGVKNFILSLKSFMGLKLKDLSFESKAEIMFT